MKKCNVCGMHQLANPAHGSNYKGIGQHSFTPEGAPEGVDVSDNIVINYGGELKAVEGDSNKFEGYLVRFSDASDPDLVGDFFTKSTEFFVEDGAVIPILYDHGLNATMKKTKIGRAKVSYDDAGLFIKGELEVADKYQEFVKEIKEKLIDAGKAGLSSGAATHLVTRKQIKKGLNEILHWGIAEGSVTPAATEPKNVAIGLKSYFDTRVDPIEGKIEDGQPAGDSTEAKSGQAPVEQGKETKASEQTEEDEPEEFLARTITSKSIKGLYEEKLKEKTPSIWETRSVLDDVYRDIAKAASVTDITGVTIDVEAKVKEAKLEEAAREIPLVVKQIEEWVEKGGSGRDGDRYFYIHSLPNTLLTDDSVKGGLGAGLVLDEHSERVVSAVEEYANLGASLVKALEELEERCKKKIEFRKNDPVKSGRTISKATLEKLAAIKKKVEDSFGMKKDLTEKLDNLLALAEPQKKAGDAAEVLQMEFAMTRNQTALALQDLPIS